MALVVEDGTALSNSESYVSVAGADQYHSDRNNTAWAVLTTAAKEAALRHGTEYLSQAYRLRWGGYRVKDSQALDWPRYMVEKRDSPAGFGNYPSYYDNASVPTEVQRACAEMALRASAGDLNPDLGANILVETTGPLVTEYDKDTPQFTRYRSIDQLLEPLLRLAGAGIQVRRA